MRWGTELKARSNSRHGRILLITRAVKFSCGASKTGDSFQELKSCCIHSPRCSMKVGPLVSSLFKVHKSSDSLCQLGLKTRLFIGGESPLKSGSRRKSLELEWCTLFFVRKESWFSGCRQIFAFEESGGVSVALFPSMRQTCCLAF